MTFALLIEALGITPNASLHGYAIDSMLEMLHWFMLVLFVGWGSFYAYTLWRFQRRKIPRRTTSARPATSRPSSKAASSSWKSSF
jgi:cytochrome c oxidase subunit 2